jgi:hypothetical protein
MPDCEEIVKKKKTEQNSLVRMVFLPYLTCCLPADFPPKTPQRKFSPPCLGYIDAG